MFLFNKQNSLKSKKEIELLFKSGSSCSVGFLRTIYLSGESSLKIGVSVPKKLISFSCKKKFNKKKDKRTN